MPSPPRTVLWAVCAAVCGFVAAAAEPSTPAHPLLRALAPDTCGQRCTGPGACAFGCFCGSKDETCHAYSACDGVGCTGPEACGSSCFCGSEDGVCHSFSKCANVKCTGPAACGSSCFCGSEDGVCHATGQCAGVKCTGPLSCGTQCKCVDGTCTSNIPNPCAATRCFMNSQCGSTCACVQGKCTPKLPPPPAGNTFLKLLQDTYTTFNQVVGLVVASQLGELGLVSVSFEPTGGPQQDANTCNTSPPAAAYDALAGLSSTFIKQVLTDIASSSEVSNGAVADAVARSSSQTTIADNLGSLQANTALASAGLGMGFGFEVYCDGVQVYQYGSGVGGGMAAAPAPALSNGFGGGGGGDAGPNTTPPTLRGNRTAVPPASGTVYKIGGGGSCACSGGSCSCLPQPDPGQGTPVASMAPYMAAHCQLPSSQVVCISGGGGGGIQEAAPSCTWGGGWNMNACASGNPALPCTRICGGGGGGGGGGQPPTDPIGKVSATCNQQCVGQPAYYNCFCPCFKKGAQQAGAPWAAQIVCQAQQ